MDINKLKEELRSIPDPPRQYGNLRHKLDEILIIGLCSVICCGEDFEDMEDFGNDREDWLCGFMELENGIPSHDTIRRVFERLNPQAVAKSLNAGLDNIDDNGGRSVRIDGKTICGSKDTKHPAYHVVSVWVSETHITLGELAVEEKSNEITVIPEHLDLIDIEGDIVTIDAMGCQTDIAAKIREAGADKDNSPLKFNVLRKIALAPLKKIALKGSSVRRKMMKASRNPDSLALVLFQT